jgi:hypothetical protein
VPRRDNINFPFIMRLARFRIRSVHQNATLGQRRPIAIPVCESYKEEIIDSPPVLDLHVDVSVKAAGHPGLWNSLNIIYHIYHACSVFLGSSFLLLPKTCGNLLRVFFPVIDDDVNHG